MHLMGVSTSEVGYTSATTGRGDHKVHKGHVVALVEEKEKKIERENTGSYRKLYKSFIYCTPHQYIL
jgi:hypothetical protein